MKNLFVYGILTDPETMGLVGSSRPGAIFAFVGKATVNNYELSFRQPVGHATISYQENSKVEGMVVMVNDLMLDLLDVVEGSPDYYSRKHITVSLNSTEELIDCDVYVMNRPGDRVTPSTNYVSKLQTGYHHFSLDQTQISQALLDTVNN